RVGGEPLAGGEPRQEALLLLVAARELDPERAELLDGDDETARRADLRELHDVPGELGALVDLVRARRDALAREGAHELADLALLVGQRVEGAHGAECSPARRGRAHPGKPAATIGRRPEAPPHGAREDRVTSLTLPNAGLEQFIRLAPSCRPAQAQRATRPLRSS